MPAILRLFEISMAAWPTVSTLFVVFCVSRVIKLRSDKKVISLEYLDSARSHILNHVESRKTARPALAGQSVGALLPTSWINPGLSWQWTRRNQVNALERAPFPYHPVSLESPQSTSSVEVARQVVSSKGPFEKPVETAQTVLLWEPNLFAAIGDEWRRHHRILGPAFASNTYKLVWKESSTLFKEMVESEAWVGQREVTLSPVNEITTEFALKILSRCGFGNALPRKSRSDIQNGMYFSEALVIVSQSSIVRLVVRGGFISYPSNGWLHKVDAAYATLGAFMGSLIKERREKLFNVKKYMSDSLMIQASETGGKLAMTDEELAGNTLLMLFAGHETTARTLNATVGFLALYQDSQEEIFAEVEAAFLQDLELSFATLNLVKVQACFLEASRLSPAGAMMTREATEDF
ncbi:cytochrome P450 [Amylostereum chailletii]|nr:cytochrome P450 [Amylostereum chailletii]